MCIRSFGFAHVIIFHSSFSHLAGIWSLLGGGGASKTVAKQDTTPHNQLSPLSSHSLLLLLVFSFQFTKEHNPYRAAVFQCKPGRKTEGSCMIKISSIAFICLFSVLWSLINVFFSWECGSRTLISIEF